MTANEAEANARSARARAEMDELALRKAKDEYELHRRGGITADEMERQQDRAEAKMRADGWTRTGIGNQWSRVSADGMGTEFNNGTGYAYIPFTPEARENYLRLNGKQGRGYGNSYNSFYNQMREIEGYLTQKQVDQEDLADQAIIAALQYAGDPENGGRLPQSANEFLTRQFGMDGKTNGILDAGYVDSDKDVVVNGNKQHVKKGSFGFTFASRGADGNMTYSPQFLSPMDVYVKMIQNYDQFPSDRIAQQRQLLLDSKLSEEEIEKAVRNSFFQRNARNRMLQMRRTQEANELRKQMALNAFWKSGSSGSGVEIAKINAASRENVARMNNTTRENIANGNNKTRLSVAELGAELKKMGYDIDEKKLAEAVRHHKANEGLRGESIDERKRHNEATEELGEEKIEHNRNRLENDKEQKEKDRKNKLELAELNAKQERGMKLTKDELDRKLKLQKLRNGGGLTTETRKAVEAELNGNKAPIKTDDNSEDENIPGYAPEQIAELKKRGYSWNGSRWVK